MTDGPQKKFKIENLNVATRKRILIILVSIIMVSIVFIWVSSFDKIFNIKVNEEESQKLTEIKENLANIFNKSQTEISDIKDKVNLLEETLTNDNPVATSTQEINEQDLEKLKNKILEQDSNTQ